MATLERNGRGERETLWEFSEDLCGRDDGALFGSECGESLSELCVAVALTGVGSAEKLLGCSEFGRKLRAIVAVGTPGFYNGDEENKCQESGDEF